MQHNRWREGAVYRNREKRHHAREKGKEMEESRHGGLKGAKGRFFFARQRGEKGKI